MTDHSKAPRPMADATSAGFPQTSVDATASPGTARPRPEPRIDRVTRRAYELYEERGGSHGFDENDWLRAERELREAELEHEFDGADSTS